MSDVNLGQGAGWWAGLPKRLRRREDALRLSLTNADHDALADPTAWAGAAEALSQTAQGCARLEVSFPENADKLMHTAVNELVRQGLRFLQLEYENDATAGAAFVAQFLPAQVEPKSARTAYVLRHDLSGKTWELGQEQPLLLGRDDDCSVQVSTLQASGRHCTIGFARRAFTLIDLRSSAGTCLDNLPLRRGIVAEFGRICLGRKETGHYVEMELRIPPGNAAYLHVISGANAGQTIPLLRPVLTIGRAPNCDLRIDAPYISREHLRIALVNDCHILTDLASTNGTIHNDRPVRGGRLVPGDRIEVGEDHFTFQARDTLDEFIQPGWCLAAGELTAQLDRTTTTLGREAGCDFLVGEARLSRRHARLVWERPGRLRLYDLASYGGVLVAGQYVADAELHGGEELAFGPVQAQVMAPQ